MKSFDRIAAAAKLPLYDAPEGNPGSDKALSFGFGTISIPPGVKYIIILT